MRDHVPPHAQAYFAHDRGWCSGQVARVGPACAELVEQLLNDRIVERLRGAQGLFEFSKRYGTSRLEAACAWALVHDSPCYRTVKTISATGADQQPLAPVQTTAACRDPRFARDAASLFASPSPQQDLLH